MPVVVKNAFKKKIKKATIYERSVKTHKINNAHCEKGDAHNKLQQMEK